MTFVHWSSKIPSWIWNFKRYNSYSYDWKTFEFYVLQNHDDLRLKTALVFRSQKRVTSWHVQGSCITLTYTHVTTISIMSLPSVRPAKSRGSSWNLHSNQLQWAFTLAYLPGGVNCCRSGSQFCNVSCILTLTDSGLWHGTCFGQ